MDGHTGYGDATHAARTVRECEAAGIAGLHIEDQLFPKRFGYHAGVKQVVPIDEAVFKLRAAMAARTNPNFLVIARTDAWGAEGGGLEEAIRRMEAYAEAGAEAVLPMVFDPEDAITVREAIPEVPMVWLAGLSGMKLKETSDSEGRDKSGLPELSVAEIRRIGYEIIIYPLAPIVAATMAVNKLLLEIRDTGLCNLKGFEEGRRAIHDAIRIEEIYSIEAQGSPSERSRPRRSRRTPLEGRR